MKQYFSLAFHSALLAHHLYAFNTIDEVDYSKTTEPLVLEVQKFGFRYITSWNMICQLIYLVIAVLADLVELVPHTRSKYEEKLFTLKGYIFTTFVFPCTLYVFFMFWSVYTINRELVFPAVRDEFFPAWLNHSLHTIILVPCVIEILMANQLLPTFKSAFFGLSLMTVMYDFVFFYTYFHCGRWLYGLFYVLNWQERVFMVIMKYVSCVFVLKIGIIMQKAIHTYRNNDKKNYKLKSKEF